MLVATDLGVDVICAAEDAAAVRAAPRGRRRAVAEAAAEVLRVEAGRPRYGVDLDETTSRRRPGSTSAR